MTMHEKHSSPVTLAVVASIVAFSFIVALGLAIGGSYALTLHVIHNQNAQQEKTAQLQVTEAVKGSVPECEQLEAMDNATKAGAPVGAYTKSLAKAIHTFYVSSKCPILLKDVSEHKSDDQILKDLGE